MQIIHCHRKRPHLNTIENLYIDAEAKNNNHLNDNHTFFLNAIFDVLLKKPPTIKANPIPASIPSGIINTSFHHPRPKQDLVHKHPPH
jgi:hypothetical protein